MCSADTNLPVFLCGQKNKPVPNRIKLFLSRTGMLLSRGATLLHSHECSHGIPSYSRQLTCAIRREILGNTAFPFLAPSVVHLTACVLTFLSIRSLCECTFCFYLHIYGFKMCYLIFYYITPTEKRCQVFLFDWRDAMIYTRYLQPYHYGWRIREPTSQSLLS